MNNLSSVQDNKEESVPDTHTHFGLSRQESKALHRSKKQLELQRSDLMIKKKQLDEALQEIHDLINGMDKVFKVGGK